MGFFEIKCPMCKGMLWVDPSSGKVVDHKSSDHKKADLGDFLKTQKSRGSELENMFHKAKEDREKRKEQLEQEFRKAREHPEDLKEDYQSPFGWD